MRFLIDAQLPPALARMMTALGFVAEHVQDVGLLEADDSQIWNYAHEHGAIIITKDEDFPARAQRGPTTRSNPTIVWLRVGNSSRRALLQWFEPLLPQIVALVQQGERLIEVR
jgi:predicted nuclease of predicted toxin-antitoxin system